MSSETTLARACLSREAATKIIGFPVPLPRGSQAPERDFGAPPTYASSTSAMSCSSPSSPFRSPIISRIACPIFQVVFWFTPSSRAITPEEMPLLDASTRNIAQIQIRKLSLVPCIGVSEVTVSGRRQSQHW